MRSVQGKLRIGLAEKSVLAALARAVVLTPPGEVDENGNAVVNARKSMSASTFSDKLDKATELVRAVYSELPSYDKIIPALLEKDG